MQMAKRRFVVVTELMLAPGDHLDADHLGCRLAVSSDGSCLALAAARGRLACLSVSATAEGVQLSEPAVYAPAAAAVAGVVELGRGRQQRLELGSVVDLAFFSSSRSSSSSGGVQHLAAISHRPGESASELLLLRWQPAGRSLGVLGRVALPHRQPQGVLGRPLRLTAAPSCPTGREVVLGRLLHLAAAPSSPTALVIMGSHAVLVLDCSAILSQQHPRSAAAAVASTVGLCDLWMLLQQGQQQQQQQGRLELPCWLGRCLLPAGPVLMAARLREQSSGLRVDRLVESLLGTMTSP
ncbi:hypothetical protein COO60DRAFT_1674970 [Scenedesmus sp. NREL 46B-D3]|nr:hypothetical protein COO60DRAFT_1674970 [Scenedesmus sp. NREL 46B-D3]